MSPKNYETVPSIETSTRNSAPETIPISTHKSDIDEEVYLDIYG